MQADSLKRTFIYPGSPDLRNPQHNLLEKVHYENLANEFASKSARRITRFTFKVVLI